MSESWLHYLRCRLYPPGNPNEPVKRCMGSRVHGSRSRMKSSFTVYMIMHSIYYMCIYMTYTYRMCTLYGHSPIPVPQFVAQIFSAWACRVQCWSLSSETWNKCRLSDSNLAHKVTRTQCNPARTWIDLKGIKTIDPKRLPQTVYRKSNCHSSIRSINGCHIPEITLPLQSAQEPYLMHYAVEFFLLLQKWMIWQLFRAQSFWQHSNTWQTRPIPHCGPKSKEKGMFKV